MTESDKNISLLLKSRLADNESFIEEDEWKVTEIKLYKKRFYKFNLSYFNIYYASLLVCTSLFTLITGIRFLYIANNTSTLLVKEKKWQDIDSSGFQKSYNYSNESKVSSKEVLKNNKSNAVVKKESLNDKNTNTKKTAPQSLSLPTQDSIKINNDLKQQELPNAIIQKTPDNSVKKTAPPKKETKVIYITKQDTIFKYDTLKVKKGKGKKK